MKSNEKLKRFFYFTRRTEVQSNKQHGLTKLMALGLIASLAVGCASTQPVGGLLYSDVSGPINATSTPRGPAKGQACAASYLGLIGMGDASISAAAKAGGVVNISHVEQKSFSVFFGVYMQYCTLVWGHKGKGAAAATTTE
jgi:hypothetical protein